MLITAALSLFFTLSNTGHAASAKASPSKPNHAGRELAVIERDKEARKTAIRSLRREQADEVAKAYADRRLSPQAREEKLRQIRSRFAERRLELRGTQRRAIRDEAKRLRGGRQSHGR